MANHYHASLADFCRFIYAKENWNIANLVTLTRAALCVPIFIFFWTKNYEEWAVGLTIIAFTTDLLDGIIARGWNQATPAGAYFDAFADKILIITLLCCLPSCAVSWKVIGWIILIEALVMIGGYAIVLRVRFWGKLKTFFQDFAVGVIIAGQHIFDFSWAEEHANDIMTVVLWATCASAVIYLLSIIRELMRTVLNHH
ncbi:MAG: CDP-alcohol phosphatidyltransferase family protein [Patescibacteria group bacterium]